MNKYLDRWINVKIYRQTDGQADKYIERYRWIAIDRTQLDEQVDKNIDMDRSIEKQKDGQID